jgi:hypothetical protein
MTLMRFLRYWLPGVICVTGIAICIARGFDETGLDAAGAMIGAGLSLYLMNLLLRIGIVGDRERDDEDEARAFFDRHGVWPDEVPPGSTAPDDSGPDDDAHRPEHKVRPPETGHRSPTAERLRSRRPSR